MPLNLSNINLDSLFTMLKGEPGTRKSTQALSFPKPQYWFSTDKKMRSLLLPMKAWGINSTDIDYDDFTTYNVPDPVKQNSIDKQLRALQVNCKYKTIILDSVTSIGDTVNIQTMKLKAGTTNKDGGEKGARVAGIPISGLDDYKAEAAAFMEIMSQLKDIQAFCGANIVMIAHVIGARTEQDKKANTSFARIIVTGGKIISAKIPAYIEEVYHMDVKTAMDADKPPDFFAWTQHAGDDFARTSLPLPLKMEFNNEPMYEKYLLPAINKLKGK